MKRQLLPTIALISLLAWTGNVTAQPNPQLPAELQPYFTAIKSVESRGYPWVIYNNTISKSYKFNSRQEAEAKASDLLAQGHNLDLGLMQLNWKYQGRRPGVTQANIFDPQVNEGVAKQIFIEFWQQAQKLAGDFNRKIMAAVGAYNNGRINLPNPSYLQKVWAALGKPVAALPDDVAATTSSGTQDAASTFGSKLDELLGRGTSKKDRQRGQIADNNDTQTQDAQAQTQDTTLGTGLMATLLGVGILAVGMLAGALLIKAVGVIKALKIAKLAVSTTKNRSKKL